MVSNPGLPLNVTKTVTYDAIGNITNKSDVGDYAYDPVHVHAVSGIAPGSTGTLTASYSYDGDGNMLSGKGRTVTWTSFDMVSQITLGTNSVGFTYDSEHARLKEANSDGSTKYYLNDPISGIMQEKVIGASLAVSWNDYVMKGGEMVALHVTAASPQIRWFHKDHLGSIVALTNESGSVVERDSYDAWGERRNPSGPDDPLYPSLSLTSQVTRGYTSHEQLDSVGLVHMNGRIYDPAIGKMMSADPFVANANDGQAYNRYAYVLNNPLSLTDPTGFKPDPPVGHTQIGHGNNNDHLNDTPANSKLCDCSLRKYEGAKRLAKLAQLRALQRLISAGDVVGGAAPISGVPSDQPLGIDAARTLGYTTVFGGPEDDWAAWGIRWDVSPASEEGGWIVQEITGSYTATAEDGTVVSKSFHFWEAWRVSPGSNVTDVVALGSKVDDTFSINAPVGVTGVDTTTATARFYEGLALPGSFVVHNPKTFGKAAPSTTDDPNLPLDRATPPVTRTKTTPF